MTSERPGAVSLYMRRTEVMASSDTRLSMALLDRCDLEHCPCVAPPGQRTECLTPVLQPVTLPRCAIIEVFEIPVVHRRQPVLLTRS